MEEHKRNIDILLGETKYLNILDVGSGKTSMNILLVKFPFSNITGICYPGDTRKLLSIKENCKGKYSLLEQDICNSSVSGKYDLVLCHLLLGEALKFDNKLEDMLTSIFNIDTKTICVIDILEDVDLDFELVKTMAKKFGYVLLKEEIFEKETEQEFEKFVGKNYIGFVFEKI